MTSDYPFIRAAGRLSGSDANYVEDVVRMAREDGAPADAWAYTRGVWGVSPDGRPRYWLTVSGLEACADGGAHETAQRLRKMAGTPAEQP